MVAAERGGCGHSHRKDADFLEHDFVLVDVGQLGVHDEHNDTRVEQLRQEHLDRDGQLLVRHRVVALEASQRWAPNTKRQRVE